MSSPKLSIIIPVYNAEKYIEECIKSVLNQKYKDFEIIIVNDGSTDNSLNIISKLKNSYGKIKLFNLENNGVSNARNFGIEQSKGEYIGFVDADDLIDEEMYLTLMKNMENESLDIIMCARENFYVNTNKTNKIFLDIDTNVKIERKFYEEKLLPLIVKLDDSISSVWSKMYRKSVIIENDIKFDVNLNINEDWNFNIDFLGFSKNFMYINKPYYKYRVENNQSLSRKFRNDYFDIYVKKYNKIYKKFVLEQKEKSDLLKIANESLCYYTSFSIINEFDKKNKMKLSEKITKVNSILSNQIVRTAANDIDLKNKKLSRKIRLYAVKKSSLLSLFLFSIIFNGLKKSYERLLVIK